MVDYPLILTGILGTSALAIPVIDAGIKPANKNYAPALAIAAFIATLELVLYSPLTAGGISTGTTGLFRSDLLAAFFSFTVLVVAIIVAFASVDYMRNDPNSSIYYSLLLFTTLGMILLAYSIDLLMIMISWELMGISSFVLAGFIKKSRTSNEASIKFFILGALSSGILLYAISLAYGITGSTNIYSVAEGFIKASPTLQPLVILSIALFIAGFGLKLSAVPFHMWIPDAYEGAPTPVGALLAAGTKKAGFVTAIRVLFIGFPVLFRIDIMTAFAILAILTMTLGNVAALTQKSITRMLAYSSIAQAGFIIVGLSVPFTTLGLPGSLFHVFTHALMKSSAFVVAAAVGYKTARYDLDNYNGLGRRMPIAAFAMTIALLALVGVPPLNGFWSKLVIVAAAIEGGSTIWWAPYLAVAAILNSAFSLGYYGIVVKRMYLDDANGPRIKEPGIFSATLIAATALIVVTGIFWSPIFDFAAEAVRGMT